MKTGIMKTAMPYSRKTAFRMYACGVRNPKPTISVAANKNPQQYFTKKIKARLKLIARIFGQEQSFPAGSKNS